MHVTLRIVDGIWKLRNPDCGALVRSKIEGFARTERFQVRDYSIQGNVEGELTLDGAPARPDDFPQPLPALPPDAFLYWLFVNEWASHIRFAGTDLSLEWLSEAVDREL